jgi:hypothetical protein
MYAVEAFLIGNCIFHEAIMQFLKRNHYYGLLLMEVIYILSIGLVWFGLGGDERSASMGFFTGFSVVFLYNFLHPSLKK